MRLSDRIARFAFAALLIAAAGTPVPVARGETAGPAIEPGSSRQTNGLTTVFRGLADSTEDAATALRNKHRLEATKALDDARRAARFLDAAADDGLKALTKQGLDTVEDGRHALQDGDPEQAADILLNGSRALRNAVASRGSAETGQQVAPRGTPPTTAEGAGVINAKGAELGKVERFISRDGCRYAVIKVEGVINLFGFIDIANKEVVVPTDQLLFGRGMVAVASDVTVDRLATSSPLETSR